MDFAFPEAKRKQWGLTCPCQERVSDILSCASLCPSLPSALLMCTVVLLPKSLEVVSSKFFLRLVLGTQGHTGSARRSSSWHQTGYAPRFYCELSWANLDQRL